MPNLLPDDLTLEQWHYICHKYEEKLRSKGYKEQPYPVERHVGNMSDSMDYVLWIAHELQFSQSLDMVRANVGFIHGVLWSWGIATAADLDKEMYDWLQQLHSRATHKLMGGSSNAKPTQDSFGIATSPRTNPGRI